MDPSLRTRQLSSPSHLYKNTPTRSTSSHNVHHQYSNQSPSSRDYSGQSPSSRDYPGQSPSSRDIPPRPYPHGRQTAIVPPIGMYPEVDTRRSTTYLPSPAESSSSSGVHTQRTTPSSAQYSMTKEEREFERMRLEDRDVDGDLDDGLDHQGYSQRKTPQPYGREHFPDDYYDQLALGQVSSPEPMPHHTQDSASSTTSGESRYAKRHGISRMPPSSGKITHSMGVNAQLSRSKSISESIASSQDSPQTLSSRHKQHRHGQQQPTIGHQSNYPSADALQRQIDVLQRNIQNVAQQRTQLIQRSSSGVGMGDAPHTYSAIHAQRQRGPTNIDKPHGTGTRHNVYATTQHPSYGSSTSSGGVSAANPLMTPPPSYQQYAKEQQPHSSNSKAIIDQLQGELQKRQLKVDRLRDKLDIARGEIEVLGDEGIARETVVTKLREKLSQTQAELTALKKEHESMMRSKDHQIHEKDVEIAKMAQNNSQMTEALNVSLTTDELDQITEQLDQLKMENDSLRLSLQCYEEAHDRAHESDADDLLKIPQKPSSLHSTPTPTLLSPNPAHSTDATTSHPSMPLSTAREIVSTQRTLADCAMMAKSIEQAVSELTRGRQPNCQALFGWRQATTESESESCAGAPLDDVDVEDVPQIVEENQQTAEELQREMDNLQKSLQEFCASRVSRDVNNSCKVQ